MGDAFDVIPDKATFDGTVRNISDAIDDLIHERTETIAGGVRKAHVGKASLTLRGARPPSTRRIGRDVQRMPSRAMRMSIDTSP